MSKLVLIDGNAIMHRAFHALPPLTTRKKEPINAVYGLVSMLLRVIVDLKPTHLAVCFDTPVPTFRKKKFKEYQAHRPEMDEDLSPQFKKAKIALESMKIAVYEKEGFEADDVIGTLAKKTSSLENVVIVTGDKDILQLVDKRVSVYLPIRGLSNAKLMRPKDVVEKLGVTPKQIVDYKALVGDPSDNYKGVMGVGPKTAVDLLDKYKSKDGVYKNLRKIKSSVKEKLEKDKESADMSYMLACIVTDVKFDYTLDEMKDWDVGGARAQTMFDEFGFRTLKRRAIGVAKTRVAENQESLF